MSDTTESTIHNFPLRLPRDVYEVVKGEAARDQRSVNAQIVWRLRQAINQGKFAERPDSERAAESA